MENLLKIRFDSFVRLNRGFDLPDSKIELGIYPVVASTNIKAYHNEYKIDGPAVVTGRSGSLGKVQYIEGKCWPLNTSLYVKDFKGNYPRYVYYFLQMMHLEQYNAGAGVPTLNQNHLHSLKLLIHSLPLQRRIASILSAYDNLIEANSRRIKILEQMAENLYKEWFVRFRFPNYQNTPIENGIPNGWKVERLKDFGITLTSGSRPKGGIDANLEKGVPSLGAESIKGLAEFDYSSVKLVPQEFYCQMKRGKNTGNDILLYKDGAYIGKTTLFRDGFPFKTYSINEHVFIISPIDQEYKNYLYFTLHQEAFFYLMQNLNRNAAQPGLSNNDINNIKVMIPNKELIAQYNLHVEPILKEIFKLAHQSANLTRQRDLLLPRLMSGQLTPLTNQ